MSLANASGETHPEQAAGVYLRLAEQQLKGEGSASRYQRAVELLEQDAACMQRAGKTSEFMRALQNVQRMHRRRRKLQELIGKRWTYLNLRPKSSQALLRLFDFARVRERLFPDSRRRARCRR